ncbi:MULTISPECIES: flagellar hook-basal body complex protein FliE [Heyndrickxia]|uniref:flagellar hook-basal body complex protein FliE n=1 Tax=Heyndrickxia TaxID=2837504 RepID=UPI0006EBECBC|nr:flagellar hook-basal body complex protein FliE [Heyndrickxia shackletonii]NEY98284.1 flagellar hook-basal body complex protein FliE [Heyndrickxia shackletonii]
MALQNINTVAANIFRPSGQINFNQNNLGQTTSANPSKTSFADMLKKSISEVNNDQIQSDVLTQKLANGDNVDLHEVMIAAQKANITLQAALEIRNKVVEAYQETMRMQV